MISRTGETVLAAILLLASLQARAEASPAALTAQANLEEQRLELDRRTAPITDCRSFDAYARTMEGTEAFPLYKLSPSARARFVGALQFNARGLASFDYSDLVRELGAADIQRVLKPFGFQHLVAVMPDVRVNSEEDQQVLQIRDSARSLRCGVGEHCNEADYPGYKCISHATCEESTAHICTSNC